MKRTILFDLDGTLLPIEFDTFFADYFRRVCRFYGSATGRDLGPAFKSSAQLMFVNDGTRRNADVFWSAVEEQVGISRTELEEWYRLFIEREGAAMGEGIVPDPAADRVVKAWKARGATIVLATNSVFPRLLLDLRARWAGLAVEDFDLVTCFETMGFCKPRPEYYREIAQRLGVDPAACLMVGNDVGMDLVPAAKTGMRTCLVVGPHTARGDVPFVPDHECTLPEVGSLA
jgi:HAD superfamily hydrolase (TIGR01509 family)